MALIKNQELSSDLESAHEEQQNLISKLAEQQLEVSLLNDKILSIREELIMATDDNDQLQLRNTQLQSVSSMCCGRRCSVAGLPCDCKSIFRNWKPLILNSTALLKVMSNKWKSSRNKIV